MWMMGHQRRCDLWTKESFVEIHFRQRISKSTYSKKWCAWKKSNPFAVIRSGLSRSAQVQLEPSRQTISPKIESKSLHRDDRILTSVKVAARNPYFFFLSCFLLLRFFRKYKPHFKINSGRQKTKQKQMWNINYMQEKNNVLTKNGKKFN